MDEFNTAEEIRQYYVNNSALKFLNIDEEHQIYSDKVIPTGSYPVFVAEHLVTKQLVLIPATMEDPLNLPKWTNAFKNGGTFIMEKTPTPFKPNFWFTNEPIYQIPAQYAERVR